MAVGHLLNHLSEYGDPHGLLRNPQDDEWAKQRFGHHLKQQEFFTLTPRVLRRL